MNKNKIGKLAISRDMVENEPIYNFFAKAKFTPIYVDTTTMHKIFIYTGVSELFRELKECEGIPEYLIEAKSDEIGGIESISVSEL